MGCGVKRPEQEKRKRSRLGDEVEVVDGDCRKKDTGWWWKEMAFNRIDLLSVN